MSEGIRSETEEVVGSQNTADLMDYIKDLKLCFQGTRETQEVSEQDDRIALKLPSGERVHV